MFAVEPVSTPAAAGPPHESGRVPIQQPHGHRQDLGAYFPSPAAPTCPVIPPPHPAPQPHARASNATRPFKHPPRGFHHRTVHHASPHPHRTPVRPPIGFHSRPGPLHLLTRRREHLVNHRNLRNPIRGLPAKPSSPRARPAPAAPSCHESRTEMSLARQPPRAPDPGARNSPSERSHRGPPQAPGRDRIPRTPAPPRPPRPDTALSRPRAVSIRGSTG